MLIVVQLILHCIQYNKLKQNKKIFIKKNII